MCHNTSDTHRRTKQRRATDACTLDTKTPTYIEASIGQHKLHQLLPLGFAVTGLRDAQRRVEVAQLHGQVKAVVGVLCHLEGLLQHAP